MINIAQSLPSQSWHGLHTTLRVIPMNTSKAITKSASDQVPNQTICEKQHELLRELRYLLDAYGPVWYSKELATRLNEIIAKPIRFRPLRKLR